MIAIGSVFIVSGILYKVCFFTADVEPAIRELVTNIQDTTDPLIEEDGAPEFVSFDDAFATLESVIIKQ